jgi:hypothetical protein
MKWNISSGTACRVAVILLASAAGLLLADGKAHAQNYCYYHPLDPRCQVNRILPPPPPPPVYYFYRGGPVGYGCRVISLSYNPQTGQPYLPGVYREWVRCN